MGIVGDVVKAKVIGSEVRKGIKEYKRKPGEHNEEGFTTTTTRCPQKLTVHVFWNRFGYGVPRCNYSLEKSCYKCIKKGKYPKK